MVSAVLQARGRPWARRCGWDDTHSVGACGPSHTWACKPGLLNRGLNMPSGDICLGTYVWGHFWLSWLGHWCYWQQCNGWRPVPPTTRETPPWQRIIGPQMSTEWRLRNHDRNKLLYNVLGALVKLSTECVAKTPPSSLWLEGKLSGGQTLDTAGKRFATAVSGGCTDREPSDPGLLFLRFRFRFRPAFVVVRPSTRPNPVPSVHVSAPWCAIGCHRLLVFWC